MKTESAKQRPGAHKVADNLMSSQFCRKQEAEMIDLTGEEAVSQTMQETPIRVTSNQLKTEESKRKVKFMQIASFLDDDNASVTENYESN